MPSKIFLPINLKNSVFVIDGFTTKVDKLTKDSHCETISNRTNYRLNLWTKIFSVLI